MALEFTQATAPTPGGVNEDAVAVGPDFAIVLDGATATGAPTGCIHDVAWYVRNLTGRLYTKLLASDADLREIVRSAVAELVSEHTATCDMTNPDSPSSTVAMARFRNGLLEVLSLADSPIVVERSDGRIDVVVDDRTSHLPSYSRDAVRALRNTDEGFWVASTRPEAADRAVVASVPIDEVRRVAVLSDGASRLPERYGWAWSRFLSALAEHGPAHIISETRSAEQTTADGAFRGKPHDDATAVLCTVLPPGTPSEQAAAG
ncbi:protein phosphatase 2C domain-containing protein [Kitasatospora xanthocidica]|uniref:protein phosphatase 2C domain-containing protein n=1 Tax=Kitasatospora xanthocidica TaxID=83382 RepID=UPI0036EE0749